MRDLREEEMRPSEFFKRLYLFERQQKRERERERGREEEADSLVSKEADTGLDPRILGS